MTTPKLEGRVTLTLETADLCLHAIRALERMAQSRCEELAMKQFRRTKNELLREIREAQSRPEPTDEEKEAMISQ
jgi:hypothetical protein